MNRLTLLVRRWGNDGAVANAHSELELAEDQALAATWVAARVRHRDTARAAASLMPTRGSRAA
jgi:hypothetical protein